MRCVCVCVFVLLPSEPVCAEGGDLGLDRAWQEDATDSGRGHERAHRNLRALGGRLQQQIAKARHYGNDLAELLLAQKQIEQWGLTGRNFQKFVEKFKGFDEKIRALDNLCNKREACTEESDTRKALVRAMECANVQVHRILQFPNQAQGWLAVYDFCANRDQSYEGSCKDVDHTLTGYRNTKCVANCKATIALELLQKAKETINLCDMTWAMTSVGDWIRNVTMPKVQMQLGKRGARFPQEFLDFSNTYQGRALAALKKKDFGVAVYPKCLAEACRTTSKLVQACKKFASELLDPAQSPTLTVAECRFLVIKRPNDETDRLQQCRESISGVH
mmetsp:Transcript_60969/g.108477  ORF Transcript_60969/g.108477 Transcript_60969/m.108477 type:complete len:333 (-) Transcript_60969:55-1053(-)